MAERLGTKEKKRDYEDLRLFLHAQKRSGEPLFSPLIKFCSFVFRTRHWQM